MPPGNAACPEKLRRFAARIVSTTRRSPRRSAYRRISTAARRDAGRRSQRGKAGGSWALRRAMAAFVGISFRSMASALVRGLWGSFVQGGRWWEGCGWIRHIRPSSAPFVADVPTVTPPENSPAEQTEEGKLTVDAAFKGAMVSSSQWFVSAAPGPLTSCIIAFRLWTSASDRRRGAAAPGSGSESESRGGVGWGSAVMVWLGEEDGKREGGGRIEGGWERGRRAGMTSWAGKVRGLVVPRSGAAAYKYG